MTNNPRKMNELASLGIPVSGRIPCQVSAAQSPVHLFSWLVGCLGSRGCTDSFVGMDWEGGHAWLGSWRTVVATQALSTHTCPANAHPTLPAPAAHTFRPAPSCLALQVPAQKYNAGYLSSKHRRMAHLLNPAMYSSADEAEQEPLEGQFCYWDHEVRACLNMAW